MKITQEILDQIKETKDGTPVKDLMILPKPIDYTWQIVGAINNGDNWFVLFWTIEGGLLCDNADNRKDLKLPAPKPTYREFRYEDVKPGMLVRRKSVKEARYFYWTADGCIVVLGGGVYSSKDALEQLELSTDGITWGPFGVNVEMA